MKQLGILCHLSSLPGEYGIGDFGTISYEYIDFLADHKFNVWQILPLNPTNDLNCPYASTCSFALDEMYVDVDEFLNSKKINKKDVRTLKKCSSTQKVEYATVKKGKKAIIDKVFNTLTEEELEELTQKLELEPTLAKYSYYVALLESYNVYDFRETPKQFWNYESQASKQFRQEHHNDILRVFYAQILLREQWAKVRQYANKKKIKIFGDLPIYPSPYSFDVFANPTQFKVNQKTLQPLVYGGVPADDFCADGQNWGTCVYNWEKLKENNYSLMFEKIKHHLEIYDVLRLDHIYGYIEHYEIDAKKPTKAQWVKTDAEDFFNKLSEEIDFKRIIIENLGVDSPSVNDIKKQFKLKGMAVWQLAQGKSADSTYLPHNAKTNDIFYLGTHDNNTFIGFLNSLNKQEKIEFCKLSNIKPKNNKKLLKDAINLAVNSKSNCVILTMQDLLGQDENHRMNVPGRAENCWDYKAPKNYLKTVNNNLKKFLNR